MAVACQFQTAFDWMHLFSGTKQWKTSPGLHGIGEYECPMFHCTRVGKFWDYLVVNIAVT